MKAKVVLWKYKMHLILLHCLAIFRNFIRLMMYKTVDNIDYL